MHANTHSPHLTISFLPKLFTQEQHTSLGTHGFCRAFVSQVIKFLAHRDSAAAVRNAQLSEQRRSIGPATGLALCDSAGFVHLVYLIQNIQHWTAQVSSASDSAMSIGLNNAQYSKRGDRNTQNIRRLHLS